MGNKKAQITVFVILALVIVIGIILVFILMEPPKIQTANEENPQVFIESCTSGYVNDVVDIILRNGGDVTPVGSVMYQGQNLTYLCYNTNYYLPCVNQRPELVTYIDQEINKYIDPKIKNCIQELKVNLEKKGYTVSYDTPVIKTGLQTKKVIVDIKTKFIMTKNDNAKEIDNFKIGVNSPIYDLAEVAIEINNQESKFCNFDILGFMATYPAFRIDKFRTGDADTIYTIETDNKDFRFAIRSCALPPGF